MAALVFEIFLEVAQVVIDVVCSCIAAAQQHQVVWRRTQLSMNKGPRA